MPNPTPQRLREMWGKASLQFGFGRLESLESVGGLGAENVSRSASSANFYRFFFGGKGSPTKIDCRKK